MNNIVKKSNKEIFIFTIIVFLSFLLVMTVFLIPTKVIAPLNHYENKGTNTFITTSVESFVRIAPIYTTKRDNNNSYLIYPSNLGEKDDFTYAKEGFENSKDKFSIEDWIKIDCFPSLILSLIIFMILYVLNRKKT